MNNRPISKIFNNVSGLNRAVLDLFKDFQGAFLSGSRAFGWATEDSDFDVCVFAGDQKRARELLDRLGGDKTQDSEYYNGSKAGASS